MNDTVVIDARQLTKRFGDTTAVADLDLRVRGGEVCGFLGRNGAGKTTTMRMLVGLVRPSSGEVRVLGRSPGHPEALARIGSLIESPTFYPHLSGRDNLLLTARYSGLPTTAVTAQLDRVGLAGRADRKFGAYSLGMKQRLGVAAALLKDPVLLILDEPTNGLDPAGVAEMRDLLRTLGQEGITVLLSSHVLTEVEQICDRVTVIDKGRLVADGTPAELRETMGSSALLITAQPQDKAVACLRGHPAVQQVDIVDETLRVVTDPSYAAELNRLLVNAGLDVTQLALAPHSLEEAFLELTTPEPTEHPAHKETTT
jgi:ABC-2 type transport system ATP-binding protein